LAQIREKAYADKYRNTRKKLMGIGVNFNTEVRGIDQWEEMLL
jgi:hypothetical protein